MIVVEIPSIGASQMNFDLKVNEHQVMQIQAGVHMLVCVMPVMNNGYEALTLTETSVQKLKTAH